MTSPCNILEIVSSKYWKSSGFSDYKILLSVYIKAKHWVKIQLSFSLIFPLRQDKSITWLKRNNSSRSFSNVKIKMVMPLSYSNNTFKPFWAYSIVWPLLFYTYFKYFKFSILLIRTLLQKPIAQFESNLSKNI